MNRVVLFGNLGALRTFKSGIKDASSDIGSPFTITEVVCRSPLMRKEITIQGSKLCQIKRPFVVKTAGTEDRTMWKLVPKKACYYTSHFDNKLNKTDEN